MANKVYPDFKLILGDYNGFKRIMNIMLITNTKEIFIQIRDYYNGKILDGGLCFKWRELSWLLDHCVKKCKASGLWSSKDMCFEIYFERDKLTGDFINVYQKTNTRRSLLVFHRNEIKHLFDNKNDIIKYATDSLDEYLNAAPMFNDMKSSTNASIESRDWTDEPIDMDVEPQTIGFQ